MPELPEVETVRRQLEPWLTGRRIARVELLAPPGPKYAGLGRAAGQTIEGVGRRGKFLLMPLSKGDELVAHLGMTGVLSPGGAGERAKHLRVAVDLEGGSPNRLEFNDTRRFGRFLIVKRGDYSALPTLAALGPEPFDDAFTAERFHQALARSAMAVKTYLLSQRPIAGVGNIYADEALWRVGVHPLTPAADVRADEAAALLHAIREVLAASIDAQGTTLNDYRTVYGQSGDYADRLDVYGRAGHECPRCGARLERLVVGGRGTTFCPDCQRHPAQRGGGAVTLGAGAGVQVAGRRRK